MRESECLRGTRLLRAEESPAELPIGYENLFTTDQSRQQKRSGMTVAANAQDDFKQKEKKQRQSDPGDESNSQSLRRLSVGCG